MMTWSQQEWVKRTHKAGLLDPNILYATTHGCNQRKVPQNDGGDGGFLASQNLVQLRQLNTTAQIHSKPFCCGIVLYAGLSYAV